MTATPPTVAVLLSVRARRHVVDPLTGAVSDVRRSVGLSEANEAALELALQMADAWDTELTAYSAGGVEVEAGLRTAAACGAARVVRVPLPDDAPADRVGASLSRVIASAGHGVVVAGVHGRSDSGGAVPAYVAHGMRAAQALGLVDLTVEQPGELVGTRRLDGGARERLRVTAPTVVSVEGAAATLRRAGLRATMAANDVEIALVDDPDPSPVVDAARVVGVAPYRPRTRVIPPPDADAARQRIGELLGATSAHPTATVLELEPDEAAAVILDHLATWGFGPHGDDATD